MIDLLTAIIHKNGMNRKQEACHPGGVPINPLSLIGATKDIRVGRLRYDIISQNRGFVMLTQVEKNPFDRDPRSVPLLRFVLHSKSLSSEILVSDGPAFNLIKMNTFKEIKLISLPCTNDDVKKILRENNILLSEYHSDDTTVELDLSDGSLYGVIGGFTKRLPNNLWEQFVPNSEVTHADFTASNSIGDYLVVGMNDPSLKRKVLKDQIITAEQALELIRIMFTYHGLYYIEPNIPINEGFYYLYRFKKLFYNYQYVWTIAAYGQGKGFNEKVQDHLASLATRLEFVCRAYDKIAFFSLRTANHDYQSKQLYHLVYFIMLITGIFDSLAHIINVFYDMNLKRKSVSLRVSEDDKSQRTSKYFQKLQQKNSSLFQYIAKKEIQNNINTFYPLRDSLQHRELLAGALLRQGSEPDKNIFILTSETAEEFKKLGISPDFIEGIGSKFCFLDALSFVKWAQLSVTLIVNNVLSLIDWDSATKQLPKDVQDKIKASHKEHQKGLGQMLGWPKEPLYF
jgi:hypothetical protein